MGSSGEDGGAGAAYIYRYHNGAWSDEQRLIAGDRLAGDGFGEHVALSGPTAVVGSRLFDGGARNSGAVYVFQHDGSTWVETQKITPSAPRRGGLFGDPKIHGDLIAVGGGDNVISGTTHIFRYNGSTWIQEQEICVETGSFGDALAIWGNTIVVGSPRESLPGHPHAGTARVYRYDGVKWVLEQTLTSDVPDEEENFGDSVDLEGDRLLIGADRSSIAPEPGKAYLFQHNGTSWILKKKIEPPQGVAGDTIGNAVAIDGNLVAIGAQFTDASAEASGANYVLGADCLCDAGRVNMETGLVRDVLSINGSSGNFDRTVEIGIGDPITISLGTAPSGPAPGNYALWAWVAIGDGCYDISALGEFLGCTVLPTPLAVGRAPQPFRCLVGGLPAQGLCRSVRNIPAPTSASFSVTRPQGLATPLDITIQGILQDFGAGNTLKYSVTNAVILSVR